MTLRCKRLTLLLGGGLLLTALSSPLLADDEDEREPSSLTPLTISEAEWDREDHRLTIKGKNGERSPVTLFDADSGRPLGSARYRDEDKWRMRIDDPVPVPCRVRADSPEASVTAPVEDAPDNCGGDTVPPVIDPPPQPDPDPQPDPTPLPPVSGNQLITAFNDLGMHCVDRDFSVFSILPPFNVVNAQVITMGAKPTILDNSQIELRYSAVADANGSINSTSFNKNNFWSTNPASGNSYAMDLFGVNLAPDQGILGQNMPGNGSLTFNHFDSAKRWFSAAGIPIVPTDDLGNNNPYPLMRVEAFDRVTGELLAATDVVVPVSDETDCQNCHANGEIAASDPSISWSTEGDRYLASQKNILKLHDQKHATTLEQSQPVLCAACHYSPALDLTRSGPQGAQGNHNTMSFAMHNHHGKLQQSGQPVFPDNGTVEQTCYQCHPGSKTQCQRGAMADGGMGCQDCHGGMLAVGGEYPLLAGGSLDGLNDGGARRPWLDLPRCQSCHTGDAVDHLGLEPVVAQAFADGDRSASPRLATNKRFAENDNTLYRDSLGHGGVACEGCHGSTHAVWPNGDPLANDNVTSTQLQGHSGSVTECSSCHGDQLALTMEGPHGMHNVNNPRWTSDHKGFYEQDRQSCMACHGIDLKGTRLSRTAADRIFESDRTQADGSKLIRMGRGTVVACDNCHNMP